MTNMIITVDNDLDEINPHCNNSRSRLTTTAQEKKEKKRKKEEADDGVDNRK